MTNTSDDWRRPLVAELAQLEAQIETCHAGTLTGGSSGTGYAA